MVYSSTFFKLFIYYATKAAQQNTSVQNT